MKSKKNKVVNKTDIILYQLHNTVVVKFSDGKYVGNIIDIHPNPKICGACLYTVQIEDGRIIPNLDIDLDYNCCIDSKYTNIFCKRYDIINDINIIPIELDNTTAGYDNNEQLYYEYDDTKDLCDIDVEWDSDLDYNEFE